MGKVYVMLPVEIIETLDAMRDSSRVSRSTQLRVIILNSLRGEASR